MSHETASTQEALALVRLSFSDDKAAPLEVVEAYVAQALRESGFVVKRVNIEWLDETTAAYTAGYRQAVEDNA